MTHKFTQGLTGPTSVTFDTEHLQFQATPKDLTSMRTLAKTIESAGLASKITIRFGVDRFGHAYYIVSTRDPDLNMLAVLNAIPARYNAVLFDTRGRSDLDLNDDIIVRVSFIRDAGDPTPTDLIRNQRIMEIYHEKSALERRLLEEPRGFLGFRTLTDETRPIFQKVCDLSTERACLVAGFDVDKEFVGPEAKRQRLT